MRNRPYPVLKCSRFTSPGPKPVNNKKLLARMRDWLAFVSLLTTVAAQPRDPWSPRDPSPATPRKRARINSHVGSRSRRVPAPGTLDVSTFGAKADNITDNTGPFQALWTRAATLTVEKYSLAPVTSGSRVPFRSLRAAPSQEPTLLCPRTISASRGRSQMALCSSRQVDEIFAEGVMSIARRRSSP